MTKVAERPKQETRVRPARGWRNWYRALVAHYANDHFAAKGERFAGSAVHPTKDVAESKAAAQDMAGWVDYLGAYPEGERP